MNYYTRHLTWAGHMTGKVINLIEKEALSIPVNTPYSFFSPVVYEGKEYWQVKISYHKISMVKVFDGETWIETEDEKLLELISERIANKQIDLNFKEAV